MNVNHYILLLSCQDRPGIVNDITNALLGVNANIVDADQHSTDFEFGVFFIRIEFVISEDFQNQDLHLQRVVEQLEILLNTKVNLFKKNEPLHCSILVSKEDHCLQEVLYQWRSKELNITIDSIISNHDEYQRVADWYGIPFHYVPSNSKHESEEKIIELTSSTSVLIMARYMQILSSEFLHNFKRPVIM